MRVYVVRHAESLGNLNERAQGPEESLSENGEKQARLLAKRFKKIKVDIIISSEFRRAERTAEIIGKAIKKKHTTSGLFNERRLPSEVYGRKWESVSNMKVWEQTRKHATDPKWHYSDEENIFDFEKRVTKALGYLSKLKKKNVLVVAHGHTIRMMVLSLAFMNGESEIKNDPRLFHEVHHNLTHLLGLRNTGITILDYNDGAWKLVTWNDHAHLD